MDEDRVQEYRALLVAHDLKGKDFIRACWTFGRYVVDHGDGVAMVARAVGRSPKWVQNRVDLARWGWAELERKLENGIDTMAQLHLDLVRDGLAKPSARDLPHVQYMPTELIAVMINQYDYDEMALRNLMHRMGHALSETIIRRVIESPGEPVTITLNLP